MLQGALKDLGLNRESLKRFLADRSPFWTFFLILAAAGGIWLHGFRLANYSLYKDDFAFVNRSLTWERWRTHFWDFHSQHWMPVFHTITAMACSLAGDLSEVPSVLRIASLLGFLLAGLTLAELAYACSGSRRAAVGAAAFFWLTSIHASVVQWYSASCATWSLAFASGGITLWMRFLVRGGWWRGVLAAVMCAVALATWSLGILVAPLTLLVAVAGHGLLSHPLARYRLIVAFVWFLLLYPAWYMALHAAHPTHAPLVDAEGRTLADAVGPVSAFEFTLRRTSEQLGLGNLAEMDPRLPRAAGILYGFGMLAACLIAWRRWRLTTPAIMLGLAIVVGGYWLPFAFRWRIGYGYLRDFDWYGCWPQFGAALILAALLERSLRSHPWHTPASDATVAALMIAVALLMGVCHKPVATDRARPLLFERQRAQLAELELIREAAHELGIPAQVVRAAIGPYAIQGAFDFDGLELVDLPETGSLQDVQQVRVLLRQILETGTVTPPVQGRDR